MATKKEMIKELVEDYSYKESDFKGLNYSDIKLMLKEAQDTVDLDEIEEVVKKDVVEEKPKKERRKVGRDELVTIMSNSTGKVIYESKTTGQEWTFTEYGQTDEIEVSELVRMKNSYPRYLKEPWIIILDEDVVDHLGLSNLYENVMTPEEVDRFFRLPSTKMKEILDGLPLGMKQLVVSKAMQGMKDRTFDSMSKIRIIEESCNVELLDI